MNKHIFSWVKSPGIIFLLFAVTLFAYRSTVSDLLRLWLDSSNVTYTHGSLLLGVSVYLFYQRWKAVRAGLIIRPGPLGLVLLLLSSLLWFLTWLGDIAIIQQLLLVAVFCFILWSILGFDNMKKLMFPIVLIICAIPVWEIINEGWLQKTTATVVAEIMELAGYNVYREGTLIHLSAGTFRVAQNCSGMRQLVAAITIGVIYSYINDIKIYWSVMMVISMAFLAFLVNMLRIFIVVLAGQLTNMEHYFVRQDHVTLGWILFAVAILIFIRGIDKYHRHFKKSEDKCTNENTVEKSDASIFSAILLTFLALVSGPVIATLYEQVSVGRCGKLSVTSAINGWQIMAVEIPGYAPAFTPADIVTENIYVNKSGDQVYSYIGYFSSQSQDHELISSLNKIADGHEWVQISKAIHYPVDNKKITEVQESIVRDARGNEKLVWYWYYLSGKRVVKPEIAKLYGIWDKLANNTGAAVILISTAITKDKETAQKELNLFVRQAAFALEGAVDGVQCDR